MNFPRKPSRLMVSFLLFCGLFAGAAWCAAQSLGGLLGAKPDAAKQNTPEDPLKRTTPRSSIYNFLQACHAENYTLAASYLDLRRIPASERAERGPKLAKDLGALLDRNARFEIGRLSNSPDGDSFEIGTKARPTLASFELNGRTINLELQPITSDGMQIWLVAPDSVALIPQLAAVSSESAVEKRLPAPLVQIRLLGTSLWAWIAMVLLAVVLSLVSRWLSVLFLAAVKPLTKTYAKSIEAYRLQALTEPLRLLLSVAVFRAGMELLALSALLRDYVLKLLALLFILGAASLVMRIVEVISDRIISRLDPRERALSYSVVPLVVRFVKICIFCVAILTIVSAWGYNTTTILAGVGVGGLAVALAAQKTIENLFGGISLISDRPVLVGDTCQFGGQLGTVEDIGLRSTRIRTLDRTVVTIPNSQFSTMTLENLSKRDRMWFHPTIRLHRETPAEPVREMMDAITKILQTHPMVDASGVPLRFTKIAEQSLDLEIFAYVLTSDSNQFLIVQSELLLRIMQTAAELHVSFAIPVQQSYSITATGDEVSGAAQRNQAKQPEYQIDGGNRT